MDLNTSFISESRGSAEAVSQSLLFLIVLSAVSGLIIVGGQMVDNTTSKESYTQNIDTFMEYNDNVESLNADQGYGFATTATTTQKISTYRSSLRHPPATTITIDGDTTIESKPLVMRGDEYQVIYDAGIIGTETTEQETTITTPIDNEYPNTQTKIIPLITTNYSSSHMFQGKTSGRTLLLTRAYSPETEMVTSTTTIEVDTEYPHIWESYFRKHSAITITSTGNPVEGDINQDARLLHYQVDLNQTE